MSLWDELLPDGPDGPVKKKVNWDSLLNDNSINNTQPVDQTQVNVGPSKAQILLQPWLDRGLSPAMAAQASTIASENRVNDMANTVYDMAGQNPLNVLKLTEDHVNRIRKKVGGNEDDFQAALNRVKSDVPKAMGKDWFSRAYGLKDKSVAVASDVHDAVSDLLTQDAYSYCSKFLDETDKKKAEINQQLEAEKAKPVEEQDWAAQKALTLQLGSLKKNYLDENGDVIEYDKATPDQKEYLNAVDKYYDDLSKTLNVGEEEKQSAKKKLRDAYYDQYAYTRSLDELYDNDVQPWVDDQQMVSVGAYTMPSVLPKDLKNIAEKRRDATAQLAALSKLYLANTSPAAVQKDFKFYGQQALKGLSTGLFGENRTTALLESFGPTERDMLDAAQQIMYSKGLQVPKDVQAKFDRSVGEIAVQGASSMVGMLPYLAIGGNFANVLKIATGFDLISAGWKGGEAAKAAGIMVDNSNAFTKVAAVLSDMAVEEIKLAPMGFAPGTGSGFVLAGKATPNIRFTNPWANSLFQFIWKPLVVTSSMYGAKATEAAVESIFSYKPFNDILTEKFGDSKELAGTLIGNLIWGFGMHKTVTPDRYPEYRDYIEKLKKEGKVGEAATASAVLKTWELQDKASTKAYKKGKSANLSDEDIFKNMKTEEERVANEQAVKTQADLEQQNFLERTVPPERISVVMRGSKMRDKEGKLIPYYHGTDAVFNRFAKGLQKTNSGGKANSRSNRLTFFTPDQEMAQTWGANVEARYINADNPYKIPGNGNVRSLTDAKIADIQAKGYNAIKGKEKGSDGQWHDVVATFGTQGIVKAQEVLPFQSKSAESLRTMASNLRSKELNMQGIHLSSVLPIDLKKAGKVALDAMATALEVGANMIEAIEKGFVALQEHPWYKKLDPETKAKFDPVIRDRLKQLFEENRPEVLAKYEKGKSEQMVDEATKKYLPDFTEQGTKYAKELDGEFISNVKSAESIVAKRKREGLTDVLDVPDVVRGALILPDFNSFKEAGKKLKKEGYNISTKRVGNRVTGERSVTATKQIGELGIEIQLHTKETFEATQEVNKLRDKWRNQSNENPQVPTIRPSEPYVSDVLRKGSINLNTTEKPENDKFAEPHSTYAEANGAAVHSKAKNLWIKPDGLVNNDKRILMGQFTSTLMGGKEDQAAKDVQYFNSVYSKVPGYSRTQDFWEIPLWQAKLRGSFKNADSYIIRDVAEAKEFIEKSGYKEVAFSVLDVTRDKVKELADLLPDVTFNLGGYTDMSVFKDNPNIKIFATIEDMAKAHDVPYSPTFDYSAFEGSTTIPRLEMSMGCKHSCAFCQVSKDNPFAEVKKEIIDAQLEGIKKLKPTYIYLNDKTFGQAANWKYLEELYGRMKKDNPDFQGFIIQTTAAAMKKTITPEFIDAAGIKFIEIGVESYNNDILKSVNKPASERLIDEAVETVRKSGAKLIPNIVVGFKEETAQTYENTLAFLEKNKDVISHANIYNLGVNEKNAAALGVDIGAVTDMDQSVSGKSFHANPELHAEYYNKFLDAAQKIVEINGPKMQYEQDMAQSKKLYDEAYAGMEDINLEGSPAKTPLEKKLKTLELPVSTQKEIKTAWSDTKKKIVGELKGKNAETKQAFADFIKTMPGLTGLNIKLRPAMLRKVNSIDFTKPTSLKKAIDYFDRVVDNATFRLNVIRGEKALSKLDEKTSESYIAKKNPRGILTNKIGATGLPLWDELKSIRNDLVNGSWEEGQKVIREIGNRADKEDRALTPEEMDQVARESFKGLLNTTNGASVDELEGAARNLSDIIKTGKTRAAARRLIINGQRAEWKTTVQDILTGKGSHPVKLDELESAHVKAKRISPIGMWYFTSSWGSILESLSRYDKTSDPGKSELHNQLWYAVVDATTNERSNRERKVSEVQDKFKEIFGGISNREMRKIIHDNTYTEHEIKYKSVFGGEKNITMTVNEAYKVWQELQDPSLLASNQSPSKEHDPYMRDGELTDLGQRITDLLSPQVKEWAQWQLDYFYKDYYSRINEVYRNRRGVDMPLHESYSPIFVADKMGAGFDVEDILAKQTLFSTADNAHLITRVNHADKLRLMDGDRVMMNYIDKMEFYTSWSDVLDLLNDTFIKDGNIRKTVLQNFGTPALDALENRIKDFANAPQDRSTLAKWIRGFVGNYTIASLAIKPKIAFNQFSSMAAYLEYAPVWDYAKQVFTDWGGTKKAFENITKSDFFKERYKMQTFDWITMETMKEDVHALNSRGGWDRFKNGTMFFTKYGDMATVLMGGIPVYKYYYDKVLKETGSEKRAQAIALQQWQTATGSTQQSGEKYDLSAVQRDPFWKILTMYKTQPFQYQRKVTAAARNLFSGKGGFSYNAKSLLLYHVVLPAMFQMVANGFKWDTRDEIQAGLLGNLNEVFIAGDIFDFLMNKVRGLPFDYQLTPLESTVASLGKVATKWSQANIIDWILGEEDKISTPELISGAVEAAKVAGDFTGVPVRYGITIEQAVDDIVNDQTKYPARRIMGWSEKTMDDAGSSLFTDEKQKTELEKLLNDTKKPTFNEIFNLQDQQEKKKKGNKKIPNF